MTAAALLLAASLGAMTAGGALAEGLRSALPAKSAGLLFTASGENAVKAGLAGRYDEAGQAAAASGNKAAQRIVEWFFPTKVFQAMQGRSKRQFEAAFQRCAGGWSGRSDQPSLRSPALSGLPGAI